MDINELINLYKKHLEKRLSHVSVKNYISDINHFIQWSDNNSDTSFSLDLLTKSLISDYSKTLGEISGNPDSKLSYISLQRHLSSLRGFCRFLLDHSYIESDPFSITADTEKHSDLWRIKDFKSFLFEKGASGLTVKYYINDIINFKLWHEKSSFKSSPEELNKNTLEEYIYRIRHVQSLSPKTINRKVSSIRSYLEFLNKYNYSYHNISFEHNNKRTFPVQISELVYDTENESKNISDKNYSKIGIIRLFQRMYEPYDRLEEKTALFISSFIISKRLSFLFSSQNNNKTMPLDMALNTLSNEYISKQFYAPHDVSTISFSLPAKIIHHARFTRPKWYKTYHTYPFVHYLHFGVLIIFAVIISIFTYQKTVGKSFADTFKPATASRTLTFKGKLLDKSGNPITEEVDIRTALYNNPTASGSAMLWEEEQNNIKPDTNGIISLILGNNTSIDNSYFDNNSPLYLGITVGDQDELSPRQQIGTSFATNANSIQGLEPITTSDRQQNVLLALDSGGKLTIGGSASPVFEATGGDFTLSGKTLILTTNSSGGNIILKPDKNGKIDLQNTIIHSAPDGTLLPINILGELAVSTSSSTSAGLQINQDSSGPIFSGSTIGNTKFIIDNQGVITRGSWAGLPIGTDFGGFGASITATGAGELLYSTSSTTYGHLSAGTTGNCLISNGRNAPSWSSCGFLTDANGTLSPINQKSDFLLGSTSTGSAKFALTNVGNGTPTLKIGNNLTLDANGSIYTGSGNINIGSSLNVNGNWGGNVDYYLDGANNTTIERSTKALVYDLEKNTGTTDTSTTTTYNIVGLPNNEGTFAYIYTKVSKDITPNPQTQTITIKINGFEVSNVSTVLGNLASSSTEHMTVVRSNNSWHLLGDSGNSDTADLAEWVPYTSSFPTPGKILSIDENGKFSQSVNPSDPKLAGIVSTNPNITIGPQTKTSVRLALSGRIPTIVTTISGNIKSGDSITSSPLLGIGMKPQKSGATVGKALENFTPSSNCSTASSIDSIPWPEDSGFNQSKPCFKIPVSTLGQETVNILSQVYGYTSSDYIYIGKVMVLANLSWAESSDFIASLDSVSISDTNELESVDLPVDLDNLSQVSPVVTAGGKVINKIEAFSSLAVGKIQSGFISTTALIAKTISAQSIKVTGTLSASTVKTDIISPLASNSITFELKGSSDSALIVKNTTTNKEVAKIDSEGNITATSASFSGNLSSNTLSSTDATISGTLYANNLIADNIEGLDARVSTLAAGLIASNTPVQNAHSAEFAQDLHVSSVSAQFATFHQGLLSLGASTFGSLSAIDSVSIGTTFILSQNSINTLGSDLEIQPLRQGGISFLAGALRISSTGDLTVSENAVFAKNLTVKGKLLTNIISPLPDEDIKINLPEGSIKNSEFRVQNSSNSAVFSIDSKGNTVSSGSATISRLNFSLVGQALARNDLEAVATGSAGTAVIRANRPELTIYNPNVTSDSLIYVTPAQNSGNQGIFVLRQSAKGLPPSTLDGPALSEVEGSFTVGLSNTLTHDLKFNWLIVN